MVINMDSEQVAKEITNKLFEACQLMSDSKVPQIQIDLSLNDGSKFDVLLTQTHKKGGI